MSLSLYRFILATLAVASCGYAADQDILTILGQQSGISTFLGFLEQSPDLVVVLNEGTFSGMDQPDDMSGVHARTTLTMPQSSFQQMRHSLRLLKQTQI